MDFLNPNTNCVGQLSPRLERMYEKFKESGTVFCKVLDTGIWYVGGKNHGNKHQSLTHFRPNGGTIVRGPDMPFTICYHSMVQYDEKSIYIIGGMQNGSISKKTWIADPTNGFQIKEGPSLNVGRTDFGCAKMTINGRTILIVAGGMGDDFKLLNSVEILDPAENNIWTPGLYLIEKLKFITLV